MTRIVGRVLVRALCFSIAALPGSLQAQRMPETEPIAGSSAGISQPANIHVDSLLQPLVAKLLERSPTLRRQWQAIGSSRIIRVTLISTPLLRESLSTRARTEVSRYASGAIRALVVLPTTTEPGAVMAALGSGLTVTVVAADGALGHESVVTTTV